MVAVIVPISSLLPPAHAKVFVILATILTQRIIFVDPAQMAVQLVAMQIPASLAQRVPTSTIKHRPVARPAQMASIQVNCAIFVMDLDIFFT